MYGCHVVPPNDDGADLGVVFFHNEGYSTACGHGTIALVTWALDEGRVPMREGESRVVVDVPSGRLETWATVEAGRVRSVRFRNVPSFVWASGIEAAGRVVDVPSGRLETWATVEAGRVRSVRFRNVPSFVWASGIEAAGRVVDVAFGGAFYATLEERVEPRELPRLIELGRAIKAAIEAEHDVVHPLEPELRGVYGVIFWQEERDEPLAQRNVTVFADGEVDRSPCGSGTSARLALLDAGGRLPRGAELRHLSIVGSEFTGRVVGEADVAGRPAVVTEVEGTAYRTGRAEFTLDADDPLREGFLLR
jgi:proline racemase